MYIDYIEDTPVIDNLIKIETQKAIRKDFYDMARCGTEIPTDSEMLEYVHNMRLTVISILEQYN